MAALTARDGTQKGAFTSDFDTLSAADTLTFDPTKKQLLVLHNTTGGSLTLTIDGNGGTTVQVDGLGAPVDVSAGISIAVPAGASRSVILASIKHYLQGVVNLTGAATLKAALFNL